MEPPEIRYTTTSDGVRIAYGIYAGGGPPLLLAGWPGGCPLPMTHRIPGMAAALAMYRRNWTPIGLDHRGTGFSTDVPPKLTMDDWIADIEAVVSAIGQAPDVVAWSAGCFPVVHLAARSPGTFRRILLANAALGGDRDASTSMLTDALSQSIPVQRFREVMIQQAFDHEVSPEQVAMLARAWGEGQSEELRQMYLAVGRAADIRDDLPRIEQPVIVLGDPAIAARSAAVAESLPRGRYVVATGHLKIGAAVAGLICELLNGMEGAGVMQARPTGAGDGVQALSGRECQILKLLAGGEGNATIAESLCLSVRTVERHTQNIYTKLRVHNRTEAAAWAHRNGMV